HHFPMVAIPSAFWPSAATAATEDEQREFVSRRGNLILATLFWAYVTFGDIVYHEAMRIEVAEVTGIMVFYPWEHRVLQHALMLPLLLWCYSMALRIGWRPARRRVAQQIAMALGFSLLMFWAMEIAHAIMRLPFGLSPPRL